MYPNVPFWMSIVLIVAGLAALAWSSDVFVDGSAALAKRLGVSPFLIGMVVIGFGTSAPELCVSVMSGISSHANLSLGNAYGSCIFNVAVIVGLSALLLPLAAKPSVVFVAGPGLATIALFSMFVLRDGVCSRFDASVLLLAFCVMLPLYCWFDSKSGGGPAAVGAGSPVELSMRAALVKTVTGLLVLVASSHALVVGSVDLARFMGVSDLVIGLTIVAVGTSLPELASAVASARRRQHEFVLGNIIGSNLFNMLAVVGLASVIEPADKLSPYILTRDLPLVLIMSLSLTFFGVNWRNPRQAGSFGRVKAILWLASFVGYTILMFLQETGRL